MRESAGIVLWRRREGRLEVLLVHPGGPFWARKDRGAWSIPKGEIGAQETAEAAAFREFEEELGVRLVGDAWALAPVRQRGGKRVLGFAVEGDLDPASIRSNLVHTEWPRGSGRMLEFPEVDRAEWMELAQARDRVNPAQVALLDELADRVEAHGTDKA
ncbi:MAG: NUDIX domain-containing protein [Gemmatimonadota bacterium]